MTADEIKRALKTCSVPSACIGCVYKDADECIRALITDALDLIDDQDERIAIMQESMAALEKQQEWVSVKDRMPEQAGYKCLVCAEYGDGKKTVFTAFTGYGEAEWYTYDVLHMEKEREADNRVHHNYRITHWMPLPEPPKEVSE